MSRLPAKNHTICGARTAVCERRLSTILAGVVRRGLSRVEAARISGISPSKFDELRKTGRIGPESSDGRKLYAIEMLDEFFDALPDENQFRR